MYIIYEVSTSTDGPSVQSLILVDLWIKYALQMILNPDKGNWDWIGQVCIEGNGSENYLMIWNKMNEWNGWHRMEWREEI